MRFALSILLIGCSLERTGLVGDAGGASGIDSGMMMIDAGMPDVCVPASMDDPCNMLDDNCDGRVDEDCACTIGSEEMCGPCLDGTRTCPDGRWTDCVGFTEQMRFFPDTDDDGFGDRDRGTDVCGDPPAGYIADGTDCDDTTNAIAPGETESCDMVDEDCDDVIDEDAGPIWYRDVDGDGFGDVAMPRQACTDPGAEWVDDNTDCDDTCVRCSPVYPIEICGDMHDNDCGGGVDTNCDCRYFMTATGQYILCSDTQNWSSSRGRCITYGGELASLETAAENAAVWAEIDAENADIWVGGSDFVETMWVWESGATIGTCVEDVACASCPMCNWASGQPNDNRDDCLMLPADQAGRWDDFDCGVSAPFLCEL